MSDAMMNLIRGQAQRVAPLTAQHGIVSSYDPNSYTAKVVLQPEGLETGWLPISSLMIGSGWGVLMPPSVGDQVLVVFTESKRGRPGTGSIVGRHYNDTQRPPGAAPSGEMWLWHQTGTYLKLTNDGKILLNSGVEIDIGNISSALHRLIDERLKTVYDAHTHSAVQTGPGTSGPPVTPLDLSAVATTILKGN